MSSKMRTAMITLLATAALLAGCQATPDEPVIYDEIHFDIDDTGIAEFVWQSPYELLETVTAHSAGGKAF